ncbi:RICIN domain-containing protein [Streptomyces sp. NBC_00209]|uniref:RICIN domain-containing protein n=1 Tax=Streptomyces sp. NBC_00209 TaxID=2975682 RepID=UPI0032495271
MRKTYAPVAVVVGLIALLAGAPGAAASTVDPNVPSAVVADPASATPEFTQHNLSDGPVESDSGDSRPFTYGNILNGLYGVCLDDSSNYGLRAHTCSNESYNNGYQSWRAAVDGVNMQFKNTKTHLCLDGSSLHGVRTHTCSDASYDNGYQKWRTYWAPGGHWVSWQNVATGKCLDYSSGHGLRLHDCSWAAWDNGYQAWNK